MDAEPAIEPVDAGPITLPYGSWPSPIQLDDLVGGVVRLSDPWVDGDDVYWIEGRPAEAGRSVLVHRASDGTTVDITPPPFDVRSRVHEYGGGAYVVAGGTVLFSHVKDGRLYRLDPVWRRTPAHHARWPVPLRRPSLRRRPAALHRHP